MTDRPGEAPRASAEREPISHAEFSRFVQEAQGMRRERDLWHQRADTALGLQDLFETWSGRWKDLARRYRSLYRKTVAINPLAASVVHRLNEMDDTVERAEQERDDARAELQAVRDLVGAQPDETTLQAVQDMMTERRHYVRQCNAMAAALRAAEGREATLREALDKLASLIIGANIHSNPRLLLEKSWEAAQFATMLESLLAAPDRSDLEAT